MPSAVACEAPELTHVTVACEDGRAFEQRRRALTHVRALAVSSLVSAIALVLTTGTARWLIGGSRLKTLLVAGLLVVVALTLWLRPDFGRIFGSATYAGLSLALMVRAEGSMDVSWLPVLLAAAWCVVASIGLARVRLDKVKAKLPEGLIDVDSSFYFASSFALHGLVVLLVNLPRLHL